MYKNADRWREYPEASPEGKAWGGTASSVACGRQLPQMGSLGGGTSLIRPLRRAPSPEGKAWGGDGLISLLRSQLPQRGSYGEDTVIEYLQGIVIILSHP